MKRHKDSPFGGLEPVWGFLLTAVYLVGMPYMFYGPLMRMVDDVRLQSSGTLAKHSDCWVFSFHGRRSSTWSVHVSYTAQDGTNYSPDIDTFMWWRKPDDSRPCVVRYDPASPDHVSTDWGLDRLVGRVLSYLVLVALPLLGEVFALGLMLTFLTGFAKSSVENTDWQTNEVTSTVWQGYCGALIRRRNRRLFVVSVILLGIGSAMFWAHTSGIWYWRGFFQGPQPITGTDLASRDFSPTRAGWISVAAPRTKDSGVEIYKTYSSGRKFREGYYLLAQVDGFPLLIHVDSLHASSPYRGTLEPIGGELKSQLKDRVYVSDSGATTSATASATASSIASFFLETKDQDSLEHYREAGIDDFKVCVLFLLFGFPAFWLSIRRSIDKGRHPFARTLAERGSLAANVQQIDLEMANGAKTFGRLRVTPHWLIVEKYWAPAAMRTSEVIWVHSWRDNTGASCCIYDRSGAKLEAGMDSKRTAEKAAAVIAALAPEAIRGYDTAVNEIWRSNPNATFPQIVRVRLPARETAVPDAARQ